MKNKKIRIRIILQRVELRSKVYIVLVKMRTYIAHTRRIEKIGVVSTIGYY